MKFCQSNLQLKRLSFPIYTFYSTVTHSNDFITIVSGGAGTGKTWSIKEVAEGVKEKGISFGAFAPSATASRQVQRKDGFKNATTIAELLKNEPLQKSLKNGVIWIDEAGLVGNKTMNQVINIAKKQEARILLTGDIKQHNSVERGMPLEFSKNTVELNLQGLVKFSVRKWMIIKKQ